MRGVFKEVSLLLVALFLFSVLTPEPDDVQGHQSAAGIPALLESDAGDALCTGRTVTTGCPLQLGGLYDKEPRLVDRKPPAKGQSQAEWVKRALALEIMKDWQGLIDWCKKWTESDPEYAGAWGVLAIAYNELNRYNDAIEAYRQALRIDPEYTAAWYNLGTVYAHLNRYNDAIEAYRQALRIDPELALAWEGLGLVYFISGNKAAALDTVRELRCLDPARADKLFNVIVPR